MKCYHQYFKLWVQLVSKDHYIQILTLQQIKHFLFLILLNTELFHYLKKQNDLIYKTLTDKLNENQIKHKKVARNFYNH